RSMNLKQTFCTLALTALFTTATPLLAHQEPTEAAAQYDLADSYYMGKGVTQDAIEAVYWYRKAAKQGHAAAQSKLGWMYQNGLGVQSDTNMAIYWYNKAAEQGYAEALRQLG
ncbi:sel1 repeat family protein, partial [Escherichia coli]|nr:sel1 repeat family protein [Escherichia coli]